MEVYNEPGPGFLEAIYQEALEIELTLREIPFFPQQELAIYYKGRKLKKSYIPDLFCHGKIVVDLKAIEKLGPIEFAQMHNYLLGTQCQLGLLLNFDARNSLESKRYILPRVGIVLINRVDPLLTCGFCSIHRIHFYP
jgi:GxxExxY protein